jgi:hypothetical protein
MRRAVVTSGARVITLDRQTSNDETVTEHDVQEPPKMARLLTRLVRDVRSLVGERAPRRQDFEDVTVGGAGDVVRLPHSFKNRVRWSVVGWQAATTGDYTNACTFWVARCIRGPLTLASIAGDFTIGSRFRIDAKTRIAGARFPWVSTGNARTATATLWRDSDGAVLATGTGTVNASGLYVVAFTSPIDIDGANLGVDLTIGVRDGGFNYAKTGTDAAFTALFPFSFPGGISVRDLRLWSAGAARPTTAAATELYWVEPLIASPHPGLVEDTSNTDTSALALKSYVPGVVTIRIEEVA